MAATKPNLDELARALEKAQADYQAAIKAQQAEEFKACIGEIRSTWASVTEAMPPVEAAVENGDITAVSETVGTWTHAVSAFTTLVKASTPRTRTRARGDGNGGNGTRSGGLRDLVLEIMRANPATDYTGSEMGKALDRSSGACANALEKLAEMGEAVQTSEKPRRFQLAPATVAAGG